MSGDELPAVTEPVGIERGLERRQLLERRVGARVLVLGDRDLLRRCPSPSKTRVLIGEISASSLPAFCAAGGALVRAQRELVLVLARDAERARDVLGGDAHRRVDRRACVSTSSGFSDGLLPPIGIIDIVSTPPATPTS